jgi:hypothetical protein
MRRCMQTVKSMDSPESRGTWRGQRARLSMETAIVILVRGKYGQLDMVDIAIFYKVHM